MSIEPLTGAIWSLSASSPFPGRYVAVAGALGDGVVVLLCAEHAPDEQLDDLPLREDDVAWLVQQEDPPALQSLSGAGPVPVRREHLAERVATLPREMTSKLREEVRRRFAPVDSDFAEPSTERPAIPLTPQFLEDLRIINTLHVEFFGVALAPHEVAGPVEAEAGKRERRVPRLAELVELFRLKPAFLPQLGADVRRAFSNEEGKVLAEIRGAGGADHGTLAVFFEDAGLDAGPITAVVATADERILAWHTFDDVEDEGRAELNVAIDLAIADDAVLILARQVTTPDDVAKAPQLWPRWSPGDDPSPVAAYVSSLALRGSGLATGGAMQVREGLEDDDGDRAVAEHLYELLRGRRIRYALDPYIPPAAEFQQVRDPGWMVQDRIGTCIDLATTFASMCVDAKIAPFIVIGHGHASVVLAPGRLITKRPPRTPPGTEPAGLAGHRITNASALLAAVDSGALLPIDVTGVTVGTASAFAAAVAAGREHLRPGALLVDVLAAHAAGVEEVPAPLSRPVVTTYVGRGSRPERLFENQRKLVDGLTGRTGLAIIHAQQGQGKSTVGRELVHSAPAGAGWFLDASSRKRLVGSLADAELQEQNLTSAALTPLSRDEYAIGALARLRESSAPWVVVFDNADGSPDEVADLLPECGPHQMVVVTTTNGEWRARAPEQTFKLGPVEAPEVLPIVSDEGLLALVDGRALLVDAFQRFFDSGGTQAELRERDPGSDAGPARGPIALVRAACDQEPDQVRASAIAALLPPDHVPLDVLGSLVGPHTSARLLSTGLLTREEGKVARMHRLVGAAVRTVNELELTEAAVSIAELDAACLAFDRWADPDTVLRFASLLEQTDREDIPAAREQGLRFFRVATMLETKGHTKPSSDLYRRAERHFDPTVNADRELLAVSWQGQARYLYQQFPRDPVRLEEALDLARRAESTFAQVNGSGAAGRFLAMQGLIEKALANAIGGTREERAARLSLALGTLDEADRRRRDLPGVDAAELLRSRYNLAGIRIDLSKVAASTDTAKLLRGARDIYEEVRDARATLYGRPLHPHIAACEHGMGIADFYAALLIEQPEPVRIARLRDAAAATFRGLQQREQLAGALDGPDVKKSLALLDKISAVRLALLAASARVTRERLEAVYEEALKDVAKDITDAEVVLG